MAAFPSENLAERRPILRTDSAMAMSLLAEEPKHTLQASAAGNATLIVEALDASFLF